MPYLLPTQHLLKKESDTIDSIIGMQLIVNGTNMEGPTYRLTRAYAKILKQTHKSLSERRTRALHK